MVASPKGLGAEKDYAVKGRQHTKDKPILSSERAPHKNKTVTVKQLSISGHEPQIGLEAKID
jgi:hypothetical protein